jgi:hypothetical protein
VCHGSGLGEMLRANGRGANAALDVAHNQT